MPPKTFQCSGCNKNRIENRFSNTSIRKYESALRAAANKARDQHTGRKGAKGPYNQQPLSLDHVTKPKCMDCTGGNVHELTCSHCGVTKDLEKFSKVMRRNPDNAVCWNCSQDRQDIEPEHRDQVQEEITIERLRTGATMINSNHGSTAIGYSGNSRSIGRSNGPSANTDYDGASDWMQPPIPVPDDPRVWSTSNRSRSPSNVSNHTYQSNASAVSQTSWANFERTNAPYREQGGYRRSSNSTVSQASGNPGFVKQGAVRQDPTMKAQDSLARQQIREAEQLEQAVLRESDDDDSGDDSDPY